MLQEGGKRRHKTRRTRKQRSHRRVSRHRPAFRKRKTYQNKSKSLVKRTRVRRRGGTRGLTSTWQSGVSGPVGSAWKSTPSTWPGAAGSSDGTTVSNHYGLSACGAGSGGVNPYFGMSSATSAAAYGGGKRYRGGKHAQHGGLGFSTLFPQPVLNAWRDVTGKMLSTGYGYAGLSAPASNNSDPTHQPIDKNYDYIGGIPPDVPSINQFAGEVVSQLGTK